MATIQRMIHICVFIVFDIQQLNLQFTYSDAASFRLEKRYSTEDICPISENNLANVTSCPTNNVHFKERSERKDCAKYKFCRGEPLVYHCLTYKERLVEVCAPMETITGSCCVEFIKEIGRVVEDYSKPCDDCPFHYQSDMSWMYSGCTQCYNHQSGRHKRNADHKCKEEHPNLIGNDSKGSSEKPPIVIYIFVLMAVATFSLGGLFGACIYLNERKHQSDETKCRKKAVENGQLGQLIDRERQSDETKYRKTSVENGQLCQLIDRDSQSCKGSEEEDVRVVEPGNMDL
uniref:Uncharacterized protein LOC111134035 n=1 Tax=Crassostrea virginica TaxID=6565 RepID=A0A8B8EFP9_CRAVI|nr:uncharacterized protein LOC111134035 [Crassostrea virginica]